MDGRGWIIQYVEEFSMIGILAEPGVYPTTAGEPKLGRGGLTQSAKDRVRGREDRKDPAPAEVWGNVIKQASEGSLGGPFEYNPEAKPCVGGGASGSQPGLSLRCAPGRQAQSGRRSKKKPRRTKRRLYTHR